jgi:hypothetical protein
MARQVDWKIDWKRLLSVGAALLGTIATIAVSVSALWSPLGTRPDRTDAPIRHEIAVKFAKLEEEVLTLRNQVQQLGEVPKDLRVGTKLTAIEGDLGNVRTRLGSLEAAVTQDPVKALAVPMLRRDLDNLKDAYRADLAAVREEVTRFTDLGKWLIGLIGTGIVGLAINNVVGGRKRQE